jgi:hypothetical protein
MSALRRQAFFRFCVFFERKERLRKKKPAARMHCGRFCCFVLFYRRYFFYCCCPPPKRPRKKSAIPEKKEDTFCPKEDRESLTLLTVSTAPSAF